MLIDWFTVGAQILNFLVLVWLMKRYLYQPILRALDARERHIASELANAETRRLEAEQAKTEYAQKNEQLEQQRCALLQKATNEAEAERHRLIEDARQAASALALQRRVALDNDAHNLDLSISQYAQAEVFAIARETLEELAASNLEDSMIDVFIRRLRELDDAARNRLANALQTEQHPLLLRSAFPLAPAQQNRLEGAVDEVLSVKCAFSYMTAPQVVCGIELLVDGHKVAWSVSEHLSALQQGVVDLVNQQAELERS